MKAINRIPLEELKSLSLFVNIVYGGRSDKNISRKVLSKLLHIGNSSSFRKYMKVVDEKKSNDVAYGAYSLRGRNLT